MKVELNRFSRMDVELYEGSFVKGFSCMTVRLQERSVGLVIRYTEAQLHLGSDARGLSRKGTTYTKGSVAI